MWFTEMLTLIIYDADSDFASDFGFDFPDLAILTQPASYDDRLKSIADTNTTNVHYQHDIKHL